MNRRFSAQESTVTKELVNTMKKMGAQNLKVNKDLMGESNQVEIVFDRSGKRYVFRCNTYENVNDNYRAAQLCIEYLFRALESYGVSNSEESLFNKVFDNFFLGFEATPDDSVMYLENQTEWYQVLGVPQNATKRDVISAFKSLAKVHHPDVGGDAETFKKLRNAYDEALNHVQ